MFTRIVVCLFCILCLFLFALSTQSSNSGNNLSAGVENTSWSELFDNFTQFYDSHTVHAHVSAPNNYYGSYSAEAIVTGNGERDDNGAVSGYYHGGIHDSDVASLTFYDLPNVSVPGSGSGWCRINGTPKGSSETEEAEDSNYYHL